MGDRRPFPRRRIKYCRRALAVHLAEPLGSRKTKTTPPCSSKAREVRHPLLSLLKNLVKL